MIQKKLHQLFQLFAQDKYLCVVSLASIVSIVIVAFTAGFGLGPDGNEYIAASFQLFDSEKYGLPTNYISFALSIMIRALYETNNLVLIRIVWHFIPAFLVPIILYMSLKPFHKKAACCSAVLLAFDFNSMYYFSRICSEAPYIVMMSLLLLSFSRLLMGVRLTSNALLNGICIFLISVIRAAGRYLLVFVAPFYWLFFRKKKFLLLIFIGFFIPYLCFSLAVSPLETKQFPSSIPFLSFARNNDLINGDTNEHVHHLVDHIEAHYLEGKLTDKNRERMITDIESSRIIMSLLLVDIGWADLSDGYGKIVQNTALESFKEATPQQWLKLIKKSAGYFIKYLIFNKIDTVFNFSSTVHHFTPKLLPLGVKKHIIEFEKRWGLPLKEEFKEYYYKKYTMLDLSVFKQTRGYLWAYKIFYNINRGMIVLCSIFVFLLALMLLTFRYKQHYHYWLMSVFGFIVLVYNFCGTLLFGIQERYRAPMDLFILIPIGWFIAEMLLTQWRGKYLKKAVMVMFLVICMFLNYKVI